MAPRKQMRKRLYAPHNPSRWIDVPVITEITFLDQKEDAQEYTWRLKNARDDSADRKVHEHRVEGSEGGPGNYIDVERIDEFRLLDQKEDAQERIYRIKNEDPPPRQEVDDTTPPQHRKSQVVRYTKGETYIDIELIDEIELIDQKEEAQERIFRLRHPDPKLSDAEIAALEKLPESENEPPYRFDPFQNVIDVRWETGVAAVWSWLIGNETFVSGPLCQPAVEERPDAAIVTDAHNVSVTGPFGGGAGGHGITAGWSVTGVPTDPVAVSFGDGQYAAVRLGPPGMPDPDPEAPPDAPAVPWNQIYTFHGPGSGTFPVYGLPLDGPEKCYGPLFFFDIEGNPHPIENPQGTFGYPLPQDAQHIDTGESMTVSWGDIRAINDETGEEWVIDNAVVSATVSGINLTISFRPPES